MTRSRHLSSRRHFWRRRQPRAIAWIPAFVMGLLALTALVRMQPVHAVDALPFKDRAEELRFQALARQLRCLQCQNESLEDSNAPLAVDLRREILQQMQAGKTNTEIKAWLTARYSDFVLYDPPLRGGTSLLWFGPLLLLAIGGLTIVGIVRRRSRAGAAASVGQSVPGNKEDW